MATLKGINFVNLEFWTETVGYRNIDADADIDVSRFDIDVEGERSLFLFLRPVFFLQKTNERYESLL